MKRFIAGFCICFFSHSLLATDLWQFENRIAVTAKPVSGTFHHLEGAGRKHIAIAGDSLAVIWEDDHSTSPQIYVTSKKTGDRKFDRIMQVSSGQEAYEPAIVPISGSQFIMAWEQDGAVYVRLRQTQQLAEPIKLSADQASQASLASMDRKAFAVWREQREQNWSLWIAVLEHDSVGELTVLSRNRVLNNELKTPVLFPSLAVNKSGLMLAWEDRQFGHTRLNYSFSADHGITFSEPQNLNEFFANRNQYDKGSGVTRVSLASYGEDEFIASWMDKRRGGIGYGIFAAMGSENSFGPNEKVHGQQGDKQPHYNPAAAGNKAGDFVAAWDDFRHGDSDIWISSYDDNDEWRLDHSPSPASGKGEQSHASIAVDDQGALHLLWVEREKTDGSTRLWYSHGEKR